VFLVTGMEAIFPQKTFRHAEEMVVRLFSSANRRPFESKQRNRGFCPSETLKGLSPRGSRKSLENPVTSFSGHFKATNRHIS
jgi:hypothetical protein